MQSLHAKHDSPPSQSSFRHLSWTTHQLYGWCVTLCGIYLLLWGLFAVVQSSNLLNFFILLCLVTTASIPSTSSALARITSFTFSVSSVVAIASIPLLGSGAAVVLASFAHLCLWFFKPKDPHAWKKTWQQLGFNTAMDGLAMACAGFVYGFSLMLLGPGLLQTTLAWSLAVAVFVIANLVILFVMVRLQHGSEMTIHTFCSNIGWSIGLGFVVHAFGGGFLAYAINRYDTQGILIFFLPIFLSAFAFQLYSREMQFHMDNLEDIIAARTQELELLNSEKDAFLAVLTHDMNSPLNTIKLTMEMIQRKPTILADRPQMIERLLRAQNMLQQLVSDIVDLGKIKAGKLLEMDMSQVDLIKVVREIVEEQSSRAETKSIHLAFNASDTYLEATVDSYQIHRAVTNLITNAIKYTPSCGNVEVSINKQDDVAEIIVKDSGYGIPEAELPHIFDPYRRVSANADKAQGTGLGLSISKVITEAHAGTLTVESKEAIGSSFKIRLPLRTKAADSVHEKEV